MASPLLDFLALADPQSESGVVDVPRVLEGRLPRSGADEMAIIERFADEANLSVGDRMTFESYAPDQVDALFGTGDVGAPADRRVGNRDGDRRRPRLHQRA